MAPALPDYWCDDCVAHFDEVKHGLDAVGMKYVLNPRIVRGLDYYMRTAFEFTTNQLGAQNAVAAGGRYDGLVKQFGGPDVPGVGCALQARCVGHVADDMVDANIQPPGVYRFNYSLQVAAGAGDQDG